MNWVFIVVAFLPQGVVVDKVMLDSQNQCVAYATGYLNGERFDKAQFRVAECIDATSGQIIKIDRNGPVKTKKVLL